MAPGAGWGGSSWGGGPWGGFLSETTTEGVTYDVTLDDTIDASDLAFVGTILIPSVIAGAASPTKVEVVFSVAMTINAAFTVPSNYAITEVEGGISIPVLSVEVTGTTPLRRATLELGTPLSSKDYYAIVINPNIISITGHSTTPDTYIFQWADMTRPTVGVPLEIPIRDFSGEVSGGILGNPDGLVFFTPAYETVVDTSTIEVEDVSVCTKAFDEYHLPNPPDPIPLATFGGAVPSLIGPSSVLWAPAHRLGQARLDLELDRSDFFEAAFDGPAYAELVETIDITRASFLNDVRWKTFPGTGATVFSTADNLTSIGPGPTTLRTLDWPKVVLTDSFPITDRLYINVQDIETLQDNLSVTESLTIQML